MQVPPQNPQRRSGLRTKMVVVVADFAARYHKRSNVESTFAMIKGKFGDAVRSKTDVAMVNEALCKVLCHNLCCVIQSMHELGIEPTFDSAVAG
jgi:transposase